MHLLSVAQVLPLYDEECIHFSWSTKQFDVTTEANGLRFLSFPFFFSTPVCGIVGMSGEVAGYLVNAKCLYQLDGRLIEELENDKYPTLSGALNHSIPLKPESVLPLRYAGSPCCFLSQPHRDCMLVVKLHAGTVKPQVQA